MKRLCAALLLLPMLALTLLAQEASRAELALGYTYMHTNAPPSGCGCFPMNGGFGSVAWRLKPNIALVGEVGATHATDITGTGKDLTLTSFLVGPRLSYMRRPSRSGEAPAHGVVPFVQVLLGGAHASGALSGTSTGSSNGFAFAAGGGMDLGINSRFGWRMFQTEYFLTRIPNRVNDYQNNFRLSSGLVFRF